MVIATGHNSYGYQTYSEFGMIWCGYDGNYFKYICIASYWNNSNDTSRLNFSIDSDGELHVQNDTFSIGAIQFIIVN